MCPSLWVRAPTRCRALPAGSPHGASGGAAAVGVVHYGEGACTDPDCQWPRSACTHDWLSGKMPAKDALALAHRPGSNAAGVFLGRPPLPPAEVIANAERKLQARQ